MSIKSILPHSRFAAIARDVGDFLLIANDLFEKAIGWHHASWQTVDPGTKLATSSTLVGVQFDPRVRAKVIELEFAGGDFNLFSELARADKPAASLHAITGGKPSDSRRFREILLPQNIGDELRAVFKNGDTVWGTFAAYRTPSSGTFSEPDTTFFSHVGQAIAGGIRHCLLRTAAEAPHRLPDGPGLMLLRKNSQGVHWAVLYGRQNQNDL